MRREIVFAPRSSVGLGIQHHGSIILQHKVQNIVKHVRAKSDIGNSFNVVLSWAQHQSGLSQPILSSPTIIPHVESRWIQHLWEGLQKIGGTLVFTDNWVVPRQRQNDTHIMDTIISSNRYNPAQVKTMNLCRLYLCITTVSDITSSDGKQIISDLVDGTRINNESSFRWPHQSKPPPCAWKLWKSAIYSIYLVGNLLKTPLGVWTNFNNSYRWWYDTDSDTCLHSREDTI